MDRPGTRRAGVACIALTLIIGGLSALLLSLFCQDSLLIKMLSPSPGQFRYWGIMSACTGAILLIIVVLLAYLEGNGHCQSRIDLE